MAFRIVNIGRITDYSYYNFLSSKTQGFLENIKTESESTNVNVYDDCNQDISIKYQRCQPNYFVIFY